MNSELNLSSNRDVLREVLMRVDYDTFLLFLTSPDYKEEVSKLLKDNAFWYHKLVFLLGGDLINKIYRWEATSSWNNYIKIYAAIQAASREEKQAAVYKHGASYSLALTLIEGIYGSPEDTASSVQGILHSYNWDHLKQFWESISDIGVLHHLAERYVPETVDYRVLIGHTLLGAVKRGDISILKYTITELTPTEELDEPIYYETVGDALSYLLQTKPRVQYYEEMLVLLRGLIASLGDDPYFLTVARGEDEYAWSLFQDSFRKSTPDTQGGIIYSLALRGYGRALEFLIEQEGGRLVKMVKWRQLLIDNIDKLETVRIALPYVNVVTKTNEVLKRAAAESPEVFELVLSDNRVDVMNDVEGTLSAILESSPEYTTHKETIARRATITRAISNGTLRTLLEISYEIKNREYWGQKILLLTRHLLFNLAALTLKEMKMIAYGLEAAGTRYKHYQKMRDTILESKTLIDLLEEKPDRSVHLIARAITFCDLDPIPLGQWMLLQSRRGESDIYKAAHSVIHQYVPRRDDQRIVRVLLLSLLEKDLIVDDLIDQSQSEGMSLTEIGISICLAAASKKDN